MTQTVCYIFTTVGDKGNRSEAVVVVVVEVSLQMFILNYYELFDKKLNNKDKNSSTCCYYCNQFLILSKLCNLEHWVGGIKSELNRCKLV